MAVHKVAITGMGVVVPGSSTPSALWDHFTHDNPQISRITVPGFNRTVPVGRAEALSSKEFTPEIPARFFSRYPIDIQLYLASLVRGVRNANLNFEASQAQRIGVFDGTSRGSFSFWVDQLSGTGATDKPAPGVPEIMFGTPGQAASIAASLFSIEGPVMTFTTTCTSGAVAIGQAYREIATGNLDIALASGHEAPINPVTLQTYLGAGLININDSAPASAEKSVAEYSGIVLGEGAITLVLENLEHARQRGATIYGLVSGYEHGNMGQHPTHVDPAGDRPARLIRTLLDKSNITTDEICAVFGHGNGREDSDTSEKYYMQKIFGKRESLVPLFTLKPIFGHLLGASGALNIAAASLLASRDFQLPEPLPSAFKASTNKQPCSIKPIESGDYILAVSYGIGGHCTAIAIRSV